MIDIAVNKPVTVKEIIKLVLIAKNALMMK